MMRSLFSGVSGLKSQQTALDVIANNIANVNTTGYKSQTVTFSDLLSQTLSGASSATSTKGGTNATQIGLGVSVSGTSTNMTVGSTQSTGVDTDVSISGNGFFVVQGGSEGEYQYTRAGSLDIDENGNLTVDGYLICGWEQYTGVDEDGNYVYNTDAKPEAINVYSDDYAGNKKVMAAKASTEASISGNLTTSSATASGTDLDTIGTTPTTFDKTTSVEVFDAQGNSYDATVSFKKCYAEDGTTSWYWEASCDDLTVSPSSGYIAFDSSGNAVTSATTTSGTYTFDNTPSLTLTPSDAGLTAFTVELDLSDITQQTTTTTSSWTTDTNGYEAGIAQGYSISSDGTIVCTYSNGETQSVGQISLAVFTNQEGLEKVGDNLYTSSVNSGNASYVVAGSGGSGSLSAGTLEMSNVDLAEQFSLMMISQRAYQANSKVLSTSDEMLQTLVNMVG